MKKHVSIPSTHLTEEDAVVIRSRLLLKEYQHRIAADYDVNPGRISEIKTGKRFPGSREKAILASSRH